MHRSRRHRKATFVYVCMCAVYNCIEACFYGYTRAQDALALQSTDAASTNRVRFVRSGVHRTSIALVISLRLLFWICLQPEHVIPVIFIQLTLTSVEKQRHSKQKVRR